ncbi:MAG: hypothetical protein R3D32_01260 [Nitratireductor sp.]
MSQSGVANGNHENLPLIRLEDSRSDPDGITLEVDFDALSGSVPIAKVIVSRSSLNRTRNGWLQLKVEDSDAIEPFWLTENGDRAGIEIEARHDHDPVLAVDGDKLREALQDSLGSTFEPGSVRTDLSLRFLVNRNNQARQWVPVSFTVNGVTQPAPGEARVRMDRVSVNEADLSQGAPAGEISVRVPQSIALGSAAGLAFEVEISCPQPLEASELPLGLVPVASALDLVVEGSGNSAANAPQDAQVFHFTIADPRALAVQGGFALQIVANAPVLTSPGGELSSEGHLEIRKFPVSVAAFWRDQAGRRLEPWAITGGDAAITVVTDKRDWATITLEGQTVHVLRDDARTEVQLEGFEISVPARIDALGHANIDELKLRIATNAKLATAVVFDISVMNRQGREICRLDDYWHEHLFSQQQFGSESGVVASHNIELAQPIMEREVREFLRKEMETSSRLPELDCRIRVRKAEVAQDENPLGWLPDISFAIRFAQESAFWPICIDVGMSATSIWIEKPVPDNGMPVLQQVVLPVTLGAMHGELDATHDEMTTPDSGGKGGFLLPSHIGIGSRHGIRTRFLPLSMGNLELALNDEPSTRARLKQLDRHLDISVPFPNRSYMNEPDAIFIDDIKQRMTTGQSTIYLGRQVWRRDGKTDTMKRQSKVFTHELLGDYLDELVSLYVSRFILGYSNNAQTPVDVDDPEIRRIISNPKIVLTHPAGIGEEQLGIYRLAARPLSRKISSRHFEVDDTGGNEALDDPMLILESVASARHVIDQLGSGLGQFCDDEGKSRLVSLDIGAGTYDVSILELEASGPVVGFDVVQSFGLGLAGEKLDSTLLARIAAILTELFDDHVVEGQFGVLTPDIRQILAEETQSVAPAAARLRSQLKRQLRRGKARLSAQIMKTGPAEYRWLDEHTLDILIHEKQEIEGLVEFDITGSKSRINRYQINGITVILHQLAAGENLPGEEGDQRGARLYLRLGRDAFDDRPWREESGRSTCAQVVEALGEIIPEIALQTAFNSKDQRPVNVIATGRTSLWPLLYSAIAETVSNWPGEARMLRSVPYSPQEMKIAVASGASLIARDSRNLQLRPTKRNPVAIIELSIRSGGIDASGKIENIQSPIAVHYLQDDSSAGQRAAGDQIDGNTHHRTMVKDINVRDRYLIGRAIPGLDTNDRLARLQAVDPLVIVHSPLTGQAIQNRVKNNMLVAQTSFTGRDRLSIVLESEGQFRRRYNVDGDRISLRSST